MLLLTDLCAYFDDITVNILYFSISHFFNDGHKIYDNVYGNLSDMPKEVRN